MVETGRVEYFFACLLVLSSKDSCPYKACLVLYSTIISLQWEETMEEYNSKHALYCWLCQEMHGAKTQVKDLQQVSNSFVMLIFLWCFHDL